MFRRQSGNPALSGNFDAELNKSGLKKGNDRGVQLDFKPCAMCWSSHVGECLVVTNACFMCGKSEYMVKDYPQVRKQAIVDAQPRPNPNTAAKPHNRHKFYALKGKEEKEKIADVVTGPLHVFLFPKHALLDLGSTLSFFTP